jgi:hypothetical protein
LQASGFRGHSLHKGLLLASIRKMQHKSDQNEQKRETCNHFSHSAILHIWLRSDIETAITAFTTEGSTKVNPSRAPLRMLIGQINSWIVTKSRHA